MYYLCNMILTPALIDFIRRNENEDTDRLLFSASRHPDIDVPFAVGQILIRRQIRDKLPTWYANRKLIFPSRLSAEQCSSELTATYKQSLITGDTLCDLTGGLGVDSYYFSKAVKQLVYVERNQDYCQAAYSNFNELGAGNIDVRCLDAFEASSMIQADTFYIDPARRGSCNKRLYALTDCEPDILRLKSLLLEKAERVIVKISPMADISETLQLLPETEAIHILSVKNECKELLFILSSKQSDSVLIHTTNFTSSGEKQDFSFSRDEEKQLDPVFTDEVSTYLYEPNSSILKAGAFKSVSTRFGINKLHPHSHLYHAEFLIDGFPGRTFKIEKVVDFSGKTLKQLHDIYPKANIATRNFSLSVAELRKKSGIAEGGDNYLFATTLRTGKAVIICCQKID